MRTKKLINNIFKILNISKKIFLFITDPLKIKRYLSTLKNIILKRKLWTRFDILLSQKLFTKSFNKGPTLLADGLWDNPNQYLRLKVFVDAIAFEKRKCLAAIMRTKKDRSKSTLLSLGFTKFYYISEEPITHEDRNKARNILYKVNTHEDILNIKLEKNFNTQIIYDTVLKLSKNPQPDIDLDLWVECFADFFRLVRFYKKIFSKNNVQVLVLSHAFKNEFGIAFFQALKHKISCYHIYSMYETLRIRKIENLLDLKKPVENLKFNEYEEISNTLKDSIYKKGKNYLKERSQRKNTDINEKMAYETSKIGNLSLNKLKIKQKKQKYVVVFCHHWYDFPHCYGMKNFSNFVDWTMTTYELAKRNPNISWIFRPHPCEDWYGGFFLKDLIKDNPSHIKILEGRIAVNEILELASAIITIHGTIAMEAVAKGIPVISSDESIYSDWKFTYNAKNRAEYISLVKNLSFKKIKVTKNMQTEASSFLYLNTAPLKKDNNRLVLKADHLPPQIIFEDLFNIINNQNDIIKNESEKISKWIKSKSKNYCINQKLDLLKKEAKNKNGENL